MYTSNIKIQMLEFNKNSLYGKEKIKINYVIDSYQPDSYQPDNNQESIGISCLVDSYQPDNNQEYIGISCLVNLQQEA